MFVEITNRKRGTLMAKLSPLGDGWPVLPGLKLLSRGKVRDTYELPGNRLLVVVTDRISIYDFGLNATVPQKGVVLNLMNHFWLKLLEKFGFCTHLIAAGSEIDQYLPDELSGNVDLQSRAMVVTRLKMAPFEFIFRLCLTGSGFKTYKKCGSLNGNKLPENMQDGDQLPFMLFDPTTKEENGHDEPASADEVRRVYPQHISLMEKAVQIVSSYAEKRGIKLADTKLEISECGMIADEVFTPDSSRWWDWNEWEGSRKGENRSAPPSKDKEIARIWGKALGIDKLDPKKPDDVAKVHAIEVPAILISRLTQTYRYIFWRPTGMTIEYYLRNVLKVKLPEVQGKKILVICGSESDLDSVKKVYDQTAISERITTHVISCHRNPDALRRLVTSGEIDKFDVVICAGGKAFALPGVLDALVYADMKIIPIAGVALGEPGSKSLLAAQLSIEEIPGQPVIINEITGQAYSGEQGLRDLLNRIDQGELPPAKIRKEKPPRFGV